MVLLRALRRLGSTLGLALLAVAPLGAQAYDPVGPQVDVGILTVEAGGWELCFSSYYGTPSGGFLPLIEAGCDGEKLLLACGASSSSTLTLLAQGPRDQVLTEVGDGATDSHLVNGAQWYLDSSGLGPGGGSWGFAAAGDAVDRDNCDVATVQGEYRLCWHVSDLAGGYRCGTTEGLNTSTQWSKHVYRYSSAIFEDDFETAGDVCDWSAAAGSADDCGQTLVLSLEPECGATYTDGGEDDLDPDFQQIGYRFAWNELRAERGFRLQISNGTSYAEEREYVELPAGTSQTPIFTCRYPENCTATYRVIAHFDHPPAHGADPVADDLVSNACTVQTAWD